MSKITLSSSVIVYTLCLNKIKIKTNKKQIFQIFLNSYEEVWSSLGASGHIGLTYPSRQKIVSSTRWWKPNLSSLILVSCSSPTFCNGFSFSFSLKHEVRNSFNSIQIQLRLGHHRHLHHRCHHHHDCHHHHCLKWAKERAGKWASEWANEQVGKWASKWENVWASG